MYSTRLTIHNGKAKMSFFREFILRLDGSSDLDGVFRVGTAGSTISSIMSNPQTLSSRPSTTLCLPKIVQPIAVRTYMYVQCTYPITIYKYQHRIEKRLIYQGLNITVHLHVHECYTPCLYIHVLLDIQLY